MDHHRRRDDNDRHTPKSNNRKSGLDSLLGNRHGVPSSTNQHRSSTQLRHVSRNENTPQVSLQAARPFLLANDPQKKATSSSSTQQHSAITDPVLAALISQSRKQLPVDSLNKKLAGERKTTITKPNSNNTTLLPINNNKEHKSSSKGKTQKVERTSHSSKHQSSYVDVQAINNNQSTITTTKKQLAHNPWQNQYHEQQPQPAQISTHLPQKRKVPNPDLHDKLHILQDNVGDYQINYFNDDKENIKKQKVNESNNILQHNEIKSNTRHIKANYSDGDAPGRQQNISTQLKEIINNNFDKQDNSKPSHQMIQKPIQHDKDNDNIVHKVINNPNEYVQLVKPFPKQQQSKDKQIKSPNNPQQATTTTFEYPRKYPPCSIPPEEMIAVYGNGDIKEEVQYNYDSQGRAIFHHRTTGKTFCAASFDDLMIRYQNNIETDPVSYQICADLYRKYAGPVKHGGNSNHKNENNKSNEDILLGFADIDKEYKDMNVLHHHKDYIKDKQISNNTATTTTNSKLQKERENKYPNATNLTKYQNMRYRHYPMFGTPIIHYLSAHCSGFYAFLPWSSFRLAEQRNAWSRVLPHYSIIVAYVFKICSIFRLSLPTAINAIELIRFCILCMLWPEGDMQSDIDHRDAVSITHQDNQQQQNIHNTNNNNSDLEIKVEQYDDTNQIQQQQQQYNNNNNNNTNTYYQNNNSFIDPFFHHTRTAHVKRNGIYDENDKFNDILSSTLQNTDFLLFSAGLPKQEQIREFMGLYNEARGGNCISQQQQQRQQNNMNSTLINSSSTTSSSSITIPPSPPQPLVDPFPDRQDRKKKISTSTPQQPKTLSRYSGYIVVLQQHIITAIIISSKVIEHRQDKLTALYFLQKYTHYLQYQQGINKMAASSKANNMLAGSSSSHNQKGNKTPNNNNNSLFSPNNSITTSGTQHGARITNFDNINYNYEDPNIQEMISTTIHNSKLAMLEMLPGMNIVTLPQLDPHNKTYLRNTVHGNQQIHNQQYKNIQQASINPQTEIDIIPFLFKYGLLYDEYRIFHHLSQPLIPPAEYYQREQQSNHNNNAHHNHNIHGGINPQQYIITPSEMYHIEFAMFKRARLNAYFLPNTLLGCIDVFLFIVRKYLGFTHNAYRDVLITPNGVVQPQLGLFGNTAIGNDNNTTSSSTKTIHNGENKKTKILYQHNAFIPYHHQQEQQQQHQMTLQSIEAAQFIEIIITRQAQHIIQSLYQFNDINWTWAFPPVLLSAVVVSYTLYTLSLHPFFAQLLFSLPPPQQQSLNDISNNYKKSHRHKQYKNTNVQNDDGDDDGIDIKQLFSSPPAIDELGRRLKAKSNAQKVDMITNDDDGDDDDSDSNTDSTNNHQATIAIALSAIDLRCKDMCYPLIEKHHLLEELLQLIAQPRQNQQSSRHNSGSHKTKVLPLQKQDIIIDCEKLWDILWTTIDHLMNPNNYHPINNPLYPLLNTNNNNGSNIRRSNNTSHNTKNTPKHQHQQQEQNHLQRAKPGATPFLPPGCVYLSRKHPDSLLFDECHPTNVSQQWTFAHVVITNTLNNNTAPTSRKTLIQKFDIDLPLLYRHKYHNINTQSFHNSSSTSRRRRLLQNDDGAPISITLDNSPTTELVLYSTSNNNNNNNTGMGKHSSRQQHPNTIHQQINTSGGHNGIMTNISGDFINEQQQLYPFINQEYQQQQENQFFSPDISLEFQPIQQQTSITPHTGAKYYNQRPPTQHHQQQQQQQQHTLSARYSGQQYQLNNNNPTIKTNRTPQNIITDNNNHNNNNNNNNNNNFLSSGGSGNELTFPQLFNPTPTRAVHYQPQLQQQQHIQQQYLYSSGSSHQHNNKQPIHNNNHNHDHNHNHNHSKTNYNLYSNNMNDQFMNNNDIDGYFTNHNTTMNNNNTTINTTLANNNTNTNNAAVLDFDLFGPSNDIFNDNSVQQTEFSSIHNQPKQHNYSGTYENDNYYNNNNNNNNANNSILSSTLLRSNDPYQTHNNNGNNKQHHLQQPIEKYQQNQQPHITETYLFDHPFQQEAITSFGFGEEHQQQQRQPAHSTRSIQDITIDPFHQSIQQNVNTNDYNNIQQPQFQFQQDNFIPQFNNQPVINNNYNQHHSNNNNIQTEWDINLELNPLNNHSHQHMFQPPPF